MSCLAGLLPILIWVIVVVAVVAIARVVLPYVSAPPIVMSIADILFKAVVAIACLWVVFYLIFCLLPIPWFR